MNIALYDNDLKLMNVFEVYLKKFGGEIYKFNTMKSILESDVIYDIAFIEVEIESGFTAAQYIYYQNHSCIIAFFTNSSAYLKQGYSFRAFRYILKSEPVNSILQQVDEVLNEFYAKNKTIYGTYKGEEFRIYIRDIFYIEAKSHNLYIFTEKGIYNMLGTLSLMLAELDPLNFVRCHKGFIVNLEYVRSIKNSKTFLLFPKNLEVPIGKKYFSEARDAYLNRNIFYNK